jgi:LPXTG-motif cell wall-anchored protein
MNLVLQIMIGLVLLSGAGFYLLRKFKTRRKLKEVADNGYETARDVLYPGKSIGSSKLHYGPVHPGRK